jgi:hypothetical protein
MQGMGGALLSLQVRHARPMNAKQTPPPRRPGKSNAQWWQPLLPALAAERCPEVEGKGNRRKKMQQRKQQSVWDHARRKEGQRRSQIFAQLKREKEDEKVRQVYRDYAEMLRAKAIADAGVAEEARARDGQGE